MFSMVPTNTTHNGSIVLQDNQVLNINGTTSVNGSNINNKSLSFGPGSLLNLPAGKILNIAGASWINGGGTFNFDPLCQVNLTGNITSQAIGGSVPTDFDVLNVSSTGVIAVSVNTNVNKWLQTAPTVVNHSNKIFTIKQKITMNGGQFLSSGAGRVALSNPSVPVEAEGTFGTLEINSSGNVLATNPININQNLLLTNGILNNGNIDVTITSNAQSAVISSSTSWVSGSLKRKVISGGLYPFPVGSATKQMKASLLFNSMSGMQYVTAKYLSNNPLTHPSVSDVIQVQDGPNYFFITAFKWLLESVS